VNTLALLPVLAAVRFDKLGDLVRIKPYSAAKCIGREFATLGQFVDVDNAAAQDIRYLLGLYQRQLGDWGQRPPPCDIGASGSVNKPGGYPCYPYVKQNIRK
jgi:hypothetical protein